MNGLDEPKIAVLVDYTGTRSGVGVIAVKMSVKMGIIFFFEKRLKFKFEFQFEIRHDGCKSQSKGNILRFGSAIANKIHV